MSIRDSAILDSKGLIRSRAANYDDETMYLGQHRQSTHTPAAECEKRLRHSSMLNEVWCVKMKNLPIWLDRIALRFPGFQATFKEFNPGKLQVQGSTQD